MPTQKKRPPAHKTHKGPAKVSNSILHNPVTVA